ncbi:DUF1302 domain-containing protein [Pseudomonas sp. BN414]|uniref:DUF1302 domain-containing protein n=1 Tax=Pseudomonas sp. BN414 TaxID=2567888 RepID=UPI002455980B|nr:DUF1302 domain-containing protein [Pseudomonas sp. BN414]MDH4566906.1 DUF1302 domain-containing protein [Pseudomonas sp. BN414]
MTHAEPHLRPARYRRFAPSLLAAGVALAALGSPSAKAVTFDINDDWKLSTNTTLTLGSSWALRNADPDLVYAPDAQSIGKPGSGIDTNGDDGRLNFDKHDAFSQVFKGLTEFDLNDGGQGAFLRFKYWYDHALETGNGDFKKFDDSGWDDLSKFKGFELLDAYVWKDFEIGNGMPLNVKLGKQVLTWGEALFFQNGINAINPLDVSAFNRPGVELKEGQLPVEMLSFNFGLSDTLSLEGFYQYNFRPSVLDGCGTFFQSADFAPEGCGPIVAAVTGNRTTANALASGTFVPRSQTEWPNDDGQYGIALRKVLEDLNDAELGLYYANYHSRFASFNGTAVQAAGPANFKTASYNSVYPEDIRLYGISLSGVVGGTAVFGELSYRPNQPLGFNGNDTIQFLLRSPNTPFTDPGVTPALGAPIEGYERKPVSQFSLGATDTISNVLGATRFAWAAEAAVNHIADLGDERFGRSGAYGRSELTTTAYNPAVTASYCITPGTANLSLQQVQALNAKNCNGNRGFFNDWSWGYRLRGALSYEGILPATVVTPSINFRHDVDGYGPNFQEGQKAVGLSLLFEYRNDYSLELAYNDFFGSNKFTTLDDRDFASVNLKVSF